MSPGNALEGNVGDSVLSLHFQAALMHMYHQRQQNREHMTALKPLLKARADINLSPAFWLSRKPRLALDSVCSRGCLIFCVLRLPECATTPGFMGCPGNKPRASCLPEHSPN